MVVVPEADFMAQINTNTRNTILLCGVALISAIAISIVAARWITRPLQNVSQASNKLAQGQLDQQIAPSSIVEIDTLSASFNQLTQRLKQSFAALRQSELTNRTIVNTIPDLMIRTKGDGTYVDIIGSDRLRGVYGVKQFNPGKTVQESLPPDLAQKRMNYIQKALKTGQLQVYEHYIVINERPQYEEVRILVLGEDEVLIMVRDIVDHCHCLRPMYIKQLNDYFRKIVSIATKE